MGCSPFDLKDYYFGELSPADRRAVDHHVAACVACREELETLQLTQTALLSVRDEEPPRRIAFVSDKVFEPKWWQTLWTGPKVGFASAAMLSFAILAHGFMAAPKTVVQQVPVAASNVTAPAPIDVKGEVARQLQPVIEKVVLESEQRQAARIAEIRAEQKKDRNEMHDLGETVGYMRRTTANYARAMMDDTSGAAQ